MTPLIIKICGLSEAETLDAALQGGADMVGFVVFPPSPRHVSLAQAGVLARQVGGRAAKVALTVDADDAMLAAIVEALDPDILQLHGRETPAHVAAVRARFGRPVMRAIAVREAADLDDIAAVEAVADRLLFDARPPPDARLPGGNGDTFDWSLLAGLEPHRPWLLAGGLTPNNVAAALAVTGAPGLDVSSGVETAPGHKDADAIMRFIANARQAHADRARSNNRPERH